MSWYKMANASNELEEQLVAIKALIPCFFYYADAKTPDNSNYIKLLSKPKRSTTTTGKTQRRGKESAEILVDRALAADDIPEHIRSKRDSIINEVQKGRGVNETISLMRTIFG